MNATLEWIKQSMKLMISAAMSGDIEYARKMPAMIQATAPNATMGMLFLVVGSVMALVVGGFMAYIGLFLNASINNSLPSVNDAAYNVTLATTRANINTGYTVIGIMFIIIGAAGCILALMSVVGMVGVAGRQ
jgi:NADH:ubiquinone oxidoreductase subunit 3 (subunit A)